MDPRTPFPGKGALNEICLSTATYVPLQKPRTGPPGEQGGTGLNGSPKIRVHLESQNVTIFGNKAVSDLIS